MVQPAREPDSRQERASIVRICTRGKRGAEANLAGVSATLVGHCWQGGLAGRGSYWHCTTHHAHAPPHHCTTRTLAPNRLPHPLPPPSPVPRRRPRGPSLVLAGDHADPQRAPINPRRAMGRQHLPWAQSAEPRSRSLTLSSLCSRTTPISPHPHSLLCRGPWRTALCPLRPPPKVCLHRASLRFVRARAVA